MGLIDDLVKGGSSALGAKLNKPSGSLGTFAKAQLIPVGSKHCTTFTFNFNPETIQMVKKVQVDESREQGQDQGRMQFKSGKAWEITLPDLIFDTYESKKDVRKVYIEKLEEFLYVDKDQHSVTRFRFQWGKFHPDFTFVATSLDVTYTMFLADGTPVRSKVKLGMKSYEPRKSSQDGAGDSKIQSPDHARIYTVRRGDTLPLISQYAYDTPVEWRRIADYNGIDDPLRVSPGARLLLPPILK